MSVLSLKMFDATKCLVFSLQHVAEFLHVPKYLITPFDQGSYMQVSACLWQWDHQTVEQRSAQRAVVNLAFTLTMWPQQSKQR